MPRTVVENAGLILAKLYSGAPEQEFRGQAIHESTGLEAHEINDAVTILVENGYAEWMRFLGTAPFVFGYVTITPRGRVEYERMTEGVKQSSEPTDRNTNSVDGRRLEDAEPKNVIAPPISASMVPIGSPYGFLDHDWEIVAERRGDADRLNVVLGYQFSSTFYNSNELVRNVEAMFEKAVRDYGNLPTAIPATLSFRPLSAGYGEHLFNEIARDIISADIAVFDTSDLNSNVMIELGVALTWGVRVLVLRNAGCPKPPTDISGQTWADYTGSGSAFSDPTHAEKLVRMVERAIRKKVRA